MFQNNNLRLIQINKNDINGASKQFLLTKKDPNINLIKKI